MQSEGDADLLIVQTAIEKDKVAIVGDDTDLLVLLVHYAPDSKDIWFLRPGKAGKCDKHTELKTLKARVGQFRDTILAFHALTGGSCILNKSFILLLQIR